MRFAVNGSQSPGRTYSMGFNVLIPAVTLILTASFTIAVTATIHPRSPQQKLLTIELIDLLRCLDRRTDAGDVPPL